MSQYQLGRLLGVSDKAVSKWETGLSSPNSKLLFRICDALCLSPNELIGGVGDDLVNKIEHIKIQRKVWADIDNSLFQKYGHCPPIEIVSRYEKEKLSIKNSDLIGLLNVISRILNGAKKAGIPLLVLGGLGSFLAYIYGITDINPLPPHYYCPNCKSIHFEKQYKNGWDLPPKYCECCQTELIRDGHGIPYEVYQHVLSNSVSADIVVSQNNYKQIQQMVSALVEEWSIDIIDYPNDSGYFRNTKSYVFKPINRRREVRVDYTNITEIEYRERISGYPFLNIIINDNYDSLFKLENSSGNIRFKAFIPSDELLENIKIHLASSGSDNKLKGLFNNHGISSYDELIYLFGKELSKKENCMAGDICSSAEYGRIVFRDDLYLAIKEKLLQYGCFDSEIAFLIMNNARRGIYSKNKIDLQTKKMLFDMGFNDSFVLYLESIKYMFSKSFVIQCVERELRATWNEIDQ